MEIDEIERNLPGEEEDRSHYDWDALDRLRKYQTPWGTMETDGCRVKRDFLPNMPKTTFLDDISGYIDDFCINWIKWTPGAAKGKFDSVSLPYTENRPEGFKLAATLKISTPDLEFRTTINEPATWRFMDYLRDLDKAGLNVKDISTKITTSKDGRAYSMTFQR